jgi:hypothetical protein
VEVVAQVVVWVAVVVLVVVMLDGDVGMDAPVVQVGGRVNKVVVDLIETIVALITFIKTEAQAEALAAAVVVPKRHVITLVLHLVAVVVEYSRVLVVAAQMALGTMEALLTIQVAAVVLPGLEVVEAGEPPEVSGLTQAKHLHAVLALLVAHQ